MRIECDNCGAKYSIADEKVAGRMIRLRCKKCGNNIRVDGTAVTMPEDPEDATRVFDTSAGGEWYVVINGEQSGPLSEPEMYQQAQSGAITADSLAWRDGMDDWQAVVDIPELASALGFADTGGEVEDEEATRVVAAPSESVAPEPFSFAGRSSALSESFAAAAPVPAATPGPAPASATVTVDNDAFFASSTAAPEPASEDGLTGQRKESSVLFSLSDLTSTRTATQKNEALPRTEGSGLIDIRVLAQSQAAVGGAAAPAPSDDGGAPAPMVTRQMVPIVPLPVRRSNTGLYVVLGIGGLIVIALAAVVVVLLLQDRSAPAPVPVAVAPAEAPAAADEGSEAAAAAPVDEPEASDEGAVVVVAADEGSAQEGSAVAQAESESEAEEQGSGTTPPAPTEERPVAVARTEAARTPAQETQRAPKPARSPAPAPSRPARTEQQRTPEPEPTPAPAEREAPPASARDVIANLNRNTAAPTPAPAPTPAAAPDVPASLSRSEVQTTIRRYRSRIAACNGANQTGTYRVSFRVAAGGSTENVSVDNADSIGTCLADVVRGMTFPRNGGETPPVTYPFSF